MIIQGNQNPETLAEVSTEGVKLTFEELSLQSNLSMPGRVMLARVQNKLYELRANIPQGTDTVIFMDTTQSDGYRVYMRTLSFVFVEAVRKLFPKARTVMEHSISGGLYCVIRQDGVLIPFDTNLRNRVKEQMRKLIDANLPIVREEMPTEEAIALFEEHRRMDKVALYQHRRKETVTVYRMNGAFDAFFGYMAPSTGYVDIFDLEIFDHGLVLLGISATDSSQVNNFIPTYLLSETYNEAEDWSELQGIFTVAQLNDAILAGHGGDVVRMNEALQDFRLMRIARRIQSEQKRVVLIAAPSSSGKTSFAHKLMTSLRVLGLRPISLSMDDYFVDREKTPLNEEGKPDFEGIAAIDLERFDADMQHLLEGREIPRVRYDFVKGTRVVEEETWKLDAASPIIIEGIHGLNPKLMAQIPERVKYRIALSVITQVNLDDHNRIPTTDLRLMRRMSRDRQFRGRDVRETIRSWPDVRKGEDRNIFPYSERADVMFNSSFIYELAVMKPILEEPLRSITPEEPEYVESRRLLSLLDYFVPMSDTSDIVNTSILREFIGGSKLV